MNYFELSFTLGTPHGYQQDLLINALADIGFDTFEGTDAGFKAYIPEKNYSKKTLEALLRDNGGLLELEYSERLIPGQNWNRDWERNFEPISIGDKVFVRATFHQSRPDFPLEIVIDPKMAFGTGHHETTSMMMQLMLETDWRGKRVLDMGTGTGILSILAEKCGAVAVTAIDYDQVCVQSAIENSSLNDCTGITVLEGGKEAIPAVPFDGVLANINRNVLLDQMDRYASVLPAGGLLLLSGFYEIPDLDMIAACASRFGLQYIRHLLNRNWVAARFEKQA